MSVKRQLKLNDLYIIQDVQPPLARQEFVGHKLRITMQLDDSYLPRHYLAVEGVLLGGPHAGQKRILQGIRLRRFDDARQVCRCKAYGFPHHQGKGSCYALDPGPFCGECGKPTKAKWSRVEPEQKTPGHLTSDDAFYSSCCEGEVFEDPELKTPYGE